MGACFSAPSIPPVDVGAIATRVGNSVKDILADLPNQMSILKDRIARDSLKQTVVPAKEMFAAKEDVTLTEAGVAESQKKLAECGLRMAAQGKLLEDLQWACWREITEPQVWNAVYNHPWPVRRLGLKAGRQANDAAVEKALDEAMAKLMEKVESGEIPGDLMASKPAEEKKEEAAPAASNGQVVPA